ncbi:MAG: Porphobilinogen deaminase [Chlamydiae bacterium]|nr:Porphobilinogen deaminase [Chlamydiota bacterium]
MKPLKNVLEENNMLITVGSRSSRLAIKQVEEVFFGLRYHYPSLKFIYKCCQTKGDKDQKTSLKDLGNSDFFTKELDHWLLSKKCQVTIHSAKDLPEPLPKGLKLIAITENKNNEDVLVLKRGCDTSRIFSKGFKVGASSLRREEGIKKLASSIQVLDIRGTIEHRLKRVAQGDLDGVVIAKVALLRLGFTDLNCIPLNIQTPQYQGNLAIIAREDDLEMEKIFSSVDVRLNKKSLYFGLNASRFLTNGAVTHYPLIEIKPKPVNCFQAALCDFLRSTHVLFTSQKTVELWLDFLETYKNAGVFFDNKKVIAIGANTAQLLIKRGILVDYIASNESQEGVISLLNQLKGLKRGFVFYPKSARARPKLCQFFKENRISFEAVDLYNTNLIARTPTPNIADFDELVFTSPSSVKSFFETFKLPQKQINYVFKGNITASYFKKMILYYKERVFI